MLKHLLAFLLLAALTSAAAAQDALYAGLAAHPLDQAWATGPAFGPIVHEPIPAKAQFGFVLEPTKGASAPVGSYARGCLTGAVPLPDTGPVWQVMRLSRNRNWGHPELVDFIERFANDMHDREGWSGLLIGDMSQPRGGPMLTGHASHQIGLDVDIWFKPMPGHVLTTEERETIEPELLAEPGGTQVLPDHWNESWVRLLRRAASYPVVARIFVHPAIKKALCATPEADRRWMSKVRAYFGHNDHFHVRIHCPLGSPTCVPQADPGADDGCGPELTYWTKLVSAPTPALIAKALQPPADAPVLSAAPKPHALTLAEMPAACAGILADGQPALLASVAPNEAPVPPPSPLRAVAAGQPVAAQP